MNLNSFNFISKTFLSLVRIQRHIKNVCFVPKVYYGIDSNNCMNRALFESKSKSKNSFKLLLIDKQCPQLASIVLQMSCSTQSIDSMDELTYERIADQTLDQLTEELELIIESNAQLIDSDLSLNNGVLTLNLGLNGIYVINKQTPNKQIWLSSPISGPKRYDYLSGDWVYKRDGISLTRLLSRELSSILNREIKVNSFDPSKLQF